MSLKTEVRLSGRPISLWAGLIELWAARRLAFLFVLRDVRLRYKQTALGALWAFLQPLLTAAIFGVVFGAWIRVPSDGIPYFPFVLVGVAAWMFFAGSVQHAAQTMQLNASLVTKVYFPRAVLPLASVGLNASDFIVTGTFAAFVVVLAGFGSTLHVAGLAFALLQLTALAIGASLACAALSAYFRDFIYVVPFGLQLLLFASPVVYPSSVMPAEMTALLVLNPLTGILGLLRWSIFDLGSVPPGAVVWSSVIALLVLCSGWLLFQRLERRIADVV